MRSSRDHLLRAFGVLGVTMLFGAGVAVAAESTNGLDDQQGDEEEIVDCAEFVEHPDCPDDTEGNGDGTDQIGTGNGDEEGNGDEGTNGHEDGNGDDEGEGPPEDTHGFVVSEAAKDRSHDERCGTHGAYVSSVARGLDDCEVPPGHRDRGDNGTDDGDGDENGLETQSSGPPAHAGPPPWAGQRGGPNR